MKATKISPRGTMLTYVMHGGWPLNCYIVEGKRRVYLIDTGCGENDGRFLRDYIEGRFGKDMPIVVINTHCHWDHVFGNSVFSDRVIIAQRECARLCREGFTEELLNGIKDELAGKVVSCPPNTLFDEELYFEEDGLRLFRSKGHTEDGLCVLDAVDRVLYAGDNVGDTVDAPLPWLTCPRHEYMAALEKMKAQDFDVLASGHNIPLDKAFINKIMAALASAE